jgi:predicted DNA-binding protein
MYMIRTSFNLPNSLHQRLHLVARSQQKSVSDLVRELLEQSLSKQEAQRLEQAYDALRQVQGIAKGKVPEASSHIDDLLYGKAGVWKGKHE